MAALSFAPCNGFALSPSLLSSLHPLIGRLKKAVNGRAEGDHENLMNGVSEVQRAFLMQQTPPSRSLASGAESTGCFCPQIFSCF